jgi:hypothetical protein
LLGKLYADCADEAADCRGSAEGVFDVFHSSSITSSSGDRSARIRVGIRAIRVQLWCSYNGCDRVTSFILFAHGLMVTPTVSPETIRVVVAFDDDTPAANAQVSIFRRGGEVLARGVTNDRGEVELPRPADLRECLVKADAGEGHLRTVPLPLEGTRADDPERLKMTLIGLALIAVIVLVLRRFWPKPPASEKSPQPG